MPEFSKGEIIKIKEDIWSLLNEAEQIYQTDIKESIKTLRKIDDLVQIPNDEGMTNKNLTDNTKTLKITYWSKRANILYERIEEFQAALKSYEEVRDLIPSDYQVYKAIGDCYRREGQYEKAIEQYNIAFEKGDMAGLSGELEATIHNSVALTYQEQGKVDDATKSYKNALALDKKNPLYLCNYGKLLFDTGKQEDAFTEWKKAQDMLQKGSVSKTVTEYNRKYIEKTLSQIFSVNNLLENFKIARCCQQPTRESSIKKFVSTGG